MSNDRYGQTWKRTYCLPDSSVPAALAAGAAGAFGAWVPLTAGLVVKLWLVMATLAIHTQGYAYTAQIGTGTDGSEVVRWEGPIAMLQIQYGASCLVLPILFAIPVDANTRIAMRCRSTGPAGSLCYSWVQFVLD